MASGSAPTSRPSPRRFAASAARTWAGASRPVSSSASRRKAAGRTARAAKTGAHRNHPPRKFTINGMDANTRTVRRSAIVFWYRSPCMPSPLDVSCRRLGRTYFLAIRAVRAVMEGHEVVFLDGGNSVDPHGMVALGKRAALTREEILPRVHVARAFTCHQMTTLILDMLDKKIEETRAGLVVLACLPTMFLDEDVEVGEAHQLFQRSMRAIRLTEHLRLGW